MPDADLFTEEWVHVPLDAREFPGYKGERVLCATCGEGVAYDRWVESDGAKLCQGCAEPGRRYYVPLANVAPSDPVPAPRCDCP